MHSFILIYVKFFYDDHTLIICHQAFLLIHQSHVRVSRPLVSVMTICRQLRDLYKRETELVDLEGAYTCRSRAYKVLQIKLGQCINDHREKGCHRVE